MYLRNEMDPWYMVAFVLTGDAGRYHRSLTKKLSARFHVPPYYEHIPPHITFVPPFTVGDMDTLTPLLKETVTKHKSHKIIVGGAIGSFNDRVIYLHVEAPEASKHLATALAQVLKPVTIPQDRHHAAFSPHATLAHKRFLGTHFYNMMEYLRTLPIESFDSSVDKLSLLVHSPHTRSWRVVMDFPLKGKN